ncbi:hypothetical protein ACIQYS_09675 [Psychrobacillus sp. NPDC096426]|uniref:hypothetical protein n=1 Tax=Psychrobacillus sp. NPDC096426 TaxID=3364491 RepID=UPI0037F93C45
MQFTYLEFKKDLMTSRSYHSFGRDFIELFEELYDIEHIQAMYLRNQFNKEELEIIFFFTNKIVVVTKESSHFRFDENSGKVISKNLYIAKDMDRKIELVINFDNKETLTLENYKDSNPDMAWDYGHEIKEIFKIS